jgi:uncharacterized protein YlxW (UPF0749 family)
LKISGVSEALRFLNAVREKADAEERDGGRERESRDQARKDSQAEASQENVGKAIEAFEADPQTKLSGIHASVQGKGPGLRVTLTDCNGAVLRQLSGEEFLRLREAASGQDSNGIRGRGKILDQKL